MPIRRGDGSGGEAGDEHRRIHPHAKVPAIALYLTDAFPQAGLGPRIGERTRGPYLTWLAYATGVLEPAILEKVLNIPHRFGTFGWGPPDEVEAVLARALAAGPYLLGDTFSAADIVIGGSFPILLQAKFLPDTPLFTSYAQRLTERPAYKGAQAKDSG